MVKPAPKLDSRTAATIARQVRLLLQPTPEGQGLAPDPDLNDRSSQGISAALIGVFARYCEIIIQRLNQVPDKNFLAFLNLLGASRLPPQPARVPLTFTLAAGSTVDAVVPAGTQVAAPPVEGDQDPVIFETKQELVVSAAQCVSLWVREAAADRYSDGSTILTTTNEQGVAPFVGNDDLPHLFYIGHDRLFGFTSIHQLDLTITLAQPNSECAVAWETWNSDAEQWHEITPTAPADSADRIRNLQESGMLSFTNLTALAAVAVNGQEHRWLRCRLTKRITPKSTAESDQIRVSQLPTINNLQLQVRLEQADLVAEAAFANQFAVDASQVLFPFGEKPALGNVFYLAHREAFAQNGAEVTLKLTILDPFSAGITDSNAPDRGSLEPELTWEFWDGKLWQLIGTTTARRFTGSITEDSTQAFLQAGEGQAGEGTVRFRLSGTPATTTINGAENYWIRVRISGGNYGREAQYAPTGMEPATFRPPIISNLKITYAITIPSQPERPEYLIQYNDFAYAPVDPATNFTPFQPTADLAPQPHPRLYLGFSLPANRPAFPNQPLSLYIRTADYSPADLTSSPTGDRPQLTWQYWQGKAWRKLTVRDSSENFTRPGLIEFLPPADLAAKAEFGLTPRYWLRVAWESGDYPLRPRLRRLLNNTTLAAQTITITAETLGSSNGTEQQVFYTTRSPVLAGQHLQVREPELPSTQEQSIIQQEEGEGAIAAIRDGTGSPQEVWVRWHEVSDFYGSGPRDRHYTLNRLTGEIQFGDGLNGLIPPMGISNLKMTRYQTGGGSRGNCPAHTIVQLKTTVPYIEKVTNPEAATGGAAAESLESLVERMPRTIRHRGRAVTLQDYEDLAKLAASEVARAKCVPLRNLQTDPTATEPGTLSVIVVPHSPSPRPLPSLELLQRVEQYLQTHSALTAKVTVLAPQYLSVNVIVELAVISLDGASAVEQAVERRLSNFLHPLTGGLDGTGWGFGREPYRSDFYRQIESVPGVDHVRSLQVELVADTPGLEVAAIQQTGLFLVYSGQHIIDLVFEES